MDAEAVAGRDRRTFGVVAVVAMALVLVAWMPVPLADVSTVLLQGLPAWLR